MYKPRLGFVLRQFDGQDVLTSFDASSWARGWLPAGRRVSTCVLPGQLLNEGQYVIEVGGDSPVIDQPYSFDASRTGAILQFEVEDDMTLPNKYYGQEGFRDARWPGALLLDLPWEQAELTEVSVPGYPLAA